MKQHPTIPRAALGVASLLAASATCAPAALTYSSLGSTVTQDFNIPGGLALGNYAWTNNSTFPGWEAFFTPDDDAATAVDTFRSTNGLGSSPIGLYWFRASGTASDGALGTRHFDSTSGFPGGIQIGVGFQNTTGFALTSFDLGYTGEQWYQTSNTASSTFSVSYSTDADSAVTGTWTPLPTLSFTAPKAGTAGGLNGNADDNRQVFAPVTVDLDSPLAPGNTLWIRWTSPNVAGLDHSIGIDDVTFSAVPEPSAATLLAAAGIGLLAGRRRRSNAR